MVVRLSLRTTLSALGVVVTVATVGTLAVLAGQPGGHAPAQAHTNQRITWHLTWDGADCLGTNGAIAIVYGPSGDELGRSTPEPVSIPGDSEPCQVEYDFYRVRAEAPFTVRVSDHTWTIPLEEASVGPLVH